MNRTVIAFFVCFHVFFCIFGTAYPSQQGQDYTNSTQKSRKRLNKKTKISKKAQSALPVLNKEKAVEAANLPEKCEPRILRFDAPQLSEKDKTFCMFLNTINFTQDGVATFFNQTFNHRSYAAEFLPHNFCHVLQFLEYGRQTNQSSEYFDSVLHLFASKLKGAVFVNCAALETMLDKTIPLFTELLVQEKMSFWKELKRTLWKNFRDRFSFLKASPMRFFEDVSDQIIQKVKVHITTPDRLRATLVRFLAGTIDKVAWSVEDQLQTWNSFKKLGEQLTMLYDNGIINDSFDINELYWGLIERYCFFLELSGAALKPDVCQAMQDDLLNGKLLWLGLEEQETGIETKAERLAHALMTTHTKIAIAQEGILTELIPTRQRLFDKTHK